MRLNEMPALKRIAANGDKEMIFWAMREHTYNSIRRAFNHYPANDSQRRTIIEAAFRKAKLALNVYGNLGLLIWRSEDEEELCLYASDDGHEDRCLSHAEDYFGLWAKAMEL